MRPKLDEASRKDPKFRAGMIFYEFQSGKPTFKYYKNFCERMGPDFMDYPEFEFWWMRFSVGNFDLDYDRSQDPKYSTITDLPTHIFERICGNLGKNYQKHYWFTLRHVCKSFRDIVDSWTPPKFNNIKIVYTENVMCLFFDGFLLYNRFQMSYIKKTENSSEIKVHKSAEVAYSGNYQDLAIDDLMSILPPPEGKLENLSISGKIDNRFAEKLSDRINNLGAKIDVDTIELKFFDPILKIIDKINGIGALKNAGMVRILGYFLRLDDLRLVPRGLKIPRFTLKYGDRIGSFSNEMVTLLFKMPHLEYCHVDVTYKGRLELEEELKKFGANKDPENPDMYTYQIPDSDEFFDINIQSAPNFNYIQHIYIERKSNST
ncbi:unnamed protein product [Caenorhabditis nigoni]